MRTLAILLLTTVTLWSLSIDGAIERALKNSPALHKAQSSVQYAHTQVQAAKAAFYPTIDAGFHWQDIDKTTAFSFTPSHRYSLSVRYNIFSGFADKASLNEKNLQSQAESLMLKAGEADLKLAVIAAYIDYLKALKAVETQKENLASLEQSYNDTKTRYEQGMIAKNELLLIDVQRLRSEQLLKSTNSMQVRSREELWRLLGGSLEAYEQIEDLNETIAKIEDFGALLQHTYEQRNELHALYLLRDAIHVHYSSLTGEYYPKVDLGAEYIINDQARYAGTTLIQVKDQWQTSVNVSWNLYKGGADEARRSGAMEQISAIESDIAAMKLDLHVQLTDAIEAYSVAKSQTDVAVRAKESAHENLRITRDRHEYGQTDTLNLLMAQSDFTAAQNNYNNAYYDLYLAFATIERISNP